MSYPRMALHVSCPLSGAHRFDFGGEKVNAGVGRGSQRYPSWLRWASATVRGMHGPCVPVDW